MCVCVFLCFYERVLLVLAKGHLFRTVIMDQEAIFLCAGCNCKQSLHKVGTLNRKIHTCGWIDSFDSKAALSNLCNPRGGKDRS